MLAFSVPV